VGALMEAAVTLARLIADGQLPRPRRGIRFIWPPEFAGTYPWLAEHEAEVKRGRWVAGLNLDMVGADQNQSASVWQFVSLPQAGAAFADHLMSWLREPFLGGQRYEETPFFGGSDHFILSDPTVNIPSPSFVQWPDKFYHSSADTLDKVSPNSLALSGALAAVYAYWLASAGPDEVRWLGHWMVTRFATQAGHRAAAAIESLGATPGPEARQKTWTTYQRQSTFHAERMTAALNTLLRLEQNLSEQVKVWSADVADLAAREDAWVRATLGAVALTEEKPADEPWRIEARLLIPRRQAPGPIELGLVFQAHSKELQAALWQIEGNAEHEAHDKATLAQYWADGQRTVADITDRVSLETGQPPDDMVLRLFKLMAETGLVELKTVG
jgi:aminopeptidase YwaD